MNKLEQVVNIIQKLCPHKEYIPKVSCEKGYPYKKECKVCKKIVSISKRDYYILDADIKLKQSVEDIKRAKLLHKKLKAYRARLNKYDGDIDIG